MSNSVLLPLMMRFNLSGCTDPLLMEDLFIIGSGPTTTRMREHS